MLFFRECFLNCLNFVNVCMVFIKDWILCCDCEVFYVVVRFFWRCGIRIFYLNMYSVVWCVFKCFGVVCFGVVKVVWYVEE